MFLSCWGFLNRDACCLVKVGGGVGLSGPVKVRWGIRQEAFINWPLNLPIYPRSRLAEFCKQVFLSVPTLWCQLMVVSSNLHTPTLQIPKSNLKEETSRGILQQGPRTYKRQPQTDPHTPFVWPPQSQKRTCTCSKGQTQRVPHSTNTSHCIFLWTSPHFVMARS